MPLLDHLKPKQLGAYATNIADYVKTNSYNLVEHVKPHLNPKQFGIDIAKLGYNGIVGPAIALTVPEKYSPRVFGYIANRLPDSIEPRSGPDAGLEVAVKHSTTAGVLEAIAGLGTMAVARYMIGYNPASGSPIDYLTLVGSVIIFVDGASHIAKSIEKRPSAFLGGWGYILDIGKELFSPDKTKTQNIINQ